MSARDYQTAAPRAPEQGFDLIELFPQCAEIEMEIGFGRGQFLIQRRASAPEAGLLGIEIKSKWAYLVAQRCARLSLANLRVVSEDARLLLPKLRPSGALARVFMSFPDPWWKKRHAKRRLMDFALLDEIARLLRPRGELFIQTDVQERAEQFRERLAAHPGFEPGAHAGRLDENPYGARSNREQRAVEDGLPIHRLLFVRR